jgi:uncharacterized protein YdhG (YjbR/CyaY superfamily)
MSTAPDAAHPPEGPAAVDAYLAAQPEPARGRLAELRALARAEAPDAEERIAYGMPTWRLRENLIHFGGFAQHVGVYPGAAAIVAFADDLTGYRTSKGAIQIPHDAPLPLDLVRRIVRWRLAEVAKLPERRRRP